MCLFFCIKIITLVVRIVMYKLLESAFFDSADEPYIL